MAYDDEDSIGLLDETEEEARKRNGLTGGMYDSGHPRVPADTSVTPGLATAKAEAVPPSITGPSESSLPATSITAGPLESSRQPSAPLGPAGQREHDLLGQGPPQYHGAKKVLDILGRATAPGRVIEQGTGLGTLGYESRLGQASHSADLEQKQAKAPLDLAYEESRTSEQKAKAEQEQAKAKALANPPQKPENLQQEYADAVTAVQRAGGDPSKDEKVQQLADAITSLQKQTPQKPDTATQEDQRYEDITARTHLGKPVSPEEKAWAGAYAQRKTLGPALTSAAADTRQQRTFTQQERMFQLHQQALSAPTKSMIEAAPTIEGLAARIDPLLDSLDSELGPGSGRWSEFWAGKIGTKNPEYTKLRTDVSLLQTALMRMHVGARGGQEMLVHFKDIIDQGKQDPDNMRAALSEIRQYAHELKQKGIAGGMSPAVLNSGEGGGGTETQIHNGFEYTKGADGLWHKGKKAQ